MRALRFEKTGSLDELSVRDVPVPTPAAGEVLVQVKAAAINPSDITNVLGKMHETTLPRTPGRDFAGVVADGSSELSGQSVFGSGGNLGFGRDGSHAEYVTVPANAVLPLPRNLSFEQGAGIGIAYVTAWAALVNAARLQADETVLILGTTGAVGGAAAHIAHRLGARVIGTVRKALDLPEPGAFPVDEWINLETAELGVRVRALTNGRGAEVVFDVVGGPMFEPANSRRGSRPARFRRRAWRLFRLKQDPNFIETSPRPNEKPNPSSFPEVVLLDLNVSLKAYTHSQAG
jgi:NADPH:quinone reductase